MAIYSSVATTSEDAAAPRAEEAIFLASGAAITRLSLLAFLIGTNSTSSTAATNPSRFSLRRADNVSASGTALSEVKWDLNDSASAADARAPTITVATGVPFLVWSNYNPLIQPQIWELFPAAVVTRPGSNTNSVHLTKEETGSAAFIKTMIWEE